MNPTDRICYLNGRFLPLGEACVSVMDRGFLFGDGVYEVIPVYGGHLFRITEHLQRLERSLDLIRLDNPLGRAPWQQLLENLVERNGGDDQSLYLQVTRGVAAARDHAFPQPTVPTLFAMTTPLPASDPARLAQGIAAVTLADARWQHCQIKAITLLPNVLLRQQARDAGAEEAILIRDGQVTEGSASNVFIVAHGVMATPPKSNLLLPGITRDLVVELAREHGMVCDERPIAQSELEHADEIWVTSSTREIVPVVRLDGVPVGGGLAGPVWQRVYAIYSAYKGAVSRGEILT